MESRIASQSRTSVRSFMTVLLAFLCILGSAIQAAETIRYGYDPANRLGTVNYANGQSIRYSYDNLGNQLQRLTLAAAQTNALPGTVTPTPATGATSIPTSVILDWTDAIDTNAADRLVYYLYLGTEATPPLVYSGWASAYTPPVVLAPLVRYTWKVVTRDSQGGESVSGPWTFTTRNDPPQAAIRATPTEAVAPFTATLTDASVSTDDAIAARQWDIGCNGSVEASTATTTTSVGTAGEVRVCLRVTDEHGAAATATTTLYGRLDTDRDGVFDNVDNCPTTANADQYNQDGDALGDVCDADRDGDGVANATDVFPDDRRYSVDADQDGIADNWELAQFGNLTRANATTDFDGDGSSDRDEFLYDSDPKAVPARVPTVPLAAGADHGLAQRPDGGVWAWGFNSSGQLGDGTQSNQGFAAFVRRDATVALGTAAAVAAGTDHSLALLLDGSVVAWGYNGSGQLGDGSYTRQSYPVPVTNGAGTPLTGVVAVAAGGSHSLALLADRTLVAWGYNGYGQLGDGTTSGRTRAAPVRTAAGQPLTGIIAIAAGENFSLALRSDGTVWAWGYNGYGQLGDDSTSNRASAQRVLGVRARPISGIQRIAAGFNHALALRADGTLLGWGRDNYGQVGDGTVLDLRHAVPVVNAAGQPVAGVQAVAAGEWHSLALTTAGAVLAWGHNDAGQLGDGSTVDRAAPTPIGLTGITAIGAGSGHSLAAAADRTAYAWGGNALYQLGDGTLTDRPTPARVLDANLLPIRPVGVPGASTDSDGDGVADSADRFPWDARYQRDADGDGLADEWELANFGNLTSAGAATDSDGDGVSDREEQAHDSNPRQAPPIQTDATVASGAAHTLALRRDGRVLAWGYNGYGQLGDGTTENRVFPLLLAAPVNVRALAAGAYHTLALTADGAVWAWGYNGYGQLGDGTTTGRLLPVRVLDTNDAPLTGVIAIAAGESFSLALRADGTLWAWGDNSQGQLGDDGTASKTKAQRLRDANGTDLTGIARIVAGWNHALALRADGRVLAWGYNGYGQLGDGSTTTRYRPLLAVDRNGAPLTAIAKLGAGRNHTLALTTGGEVLAWGYNGQGQLGDGTTTNRVRPERVYGADQFPLSAIRDIAAGRDHSLAIAANRSVLSWGGNDEWQLGAAVQGYSAVAVAVPGVTRALRVAAGSDASLALDTDGGLRAWGSNSYGQLGDGTQWDRPAAVAVWDGNLEPLGYLGQAGLADSDGDGAADTADAFPMDRRYKADTDRDGLADEWEQSYFSNLTTAGAGRDSDGDGVSDSNEFAAGSNPRLGAARQGRVLAAGADHSLALQIDGAVLAWGANGYGQLGDGTTASQANPKRIAGLSAIVAVAAGERHSLALGRDGRVWAWGYNGYGQLGDGTETNRTTPVAVGDEGGSPLAGIIAIAAEGYHSLALRADGTVFAWGYNGYGELGDGSSTSRSRARLLREQNGGAITGIVAIGAGSNHSVALKGNGRLLGWGANGYGQLGDGTGTGRNRAVAALDPDGVALTGVVGVSAQGSFTLARLTTGQTSAWGYNGQGQLGDGSTRNRGYPLPVVDGAYNPIGSIGAIAGGWRHGLALIGSGTQAGRLLAWGEGRQGQLGDGTWVVTRTRAGLVRSQAGGNLTGVRAVAAGGYHSLALLTDGTLLAWGDNSAGQLGTGTTADQPWPVPVRDGNGEPMARIGQPGDPTDPALDSDGDGTVDRLDAFPYDRRYAADTDADGLPDEWERANFGNLTATDGSRDSDGDGVSDRDEQAAGSNPRLAPPIATDAVMAVGVHHVLALQRDGSVLAWGYNSSGQLGDGTTNSRTIPQRIGTLTGIRALAAGERHSLALAADGKVWAWGANGSGQLGRGTTTGSLVPVQVLTGAGTPLTGIIAIRAGAAHSLALGADGTVWVWGENGDGELADGTGTDRTFAQRVRDANATTLVGIRAIAAGAYHNLALKSDGRVLAWGYNGYGQLGDNTTTTRQRAQTVLYDLARTLTGITAIAAGGNHSLALDGAGHVFAWGANGYGQLGEGGTANRYLPKWVIDGDGFPLTGIQGIAAGQEHSLALGATAGLLGWGRNDQGQLGDGSAYDRPWAAAVLAVDGSAPAQVRLIAAGGAHSLALLANGTLMGWGDNDDGEVGDRSQWDRPWAVSVRDGNLEPLGNIGQAGTADSDGDGAPNTSDAFPYDARYRADSDRDGLPDEWEQTFFAGLSQTATADRDGDGVSNGEEFAHGANPSVAPVRQGKPIAAGVAHSLAVRSDGTVLAWGDNGYGQLGDGTTVDQAYPKSIAGLTGIAGVAAGQYHSVALGRDGRVWAWGYNGDGQLGDTTTINRSTPVAVRDSLGNPLAGIIAIAVGGAHNLALRADGIVLAWGTNGYGQLGDGSTTQSTRARVLDDANGGAISGIVAIGAGYSHSVALKGDGRLLGWGANGSGQLGDSTWSTRYRPVVALDPDQLPLTSVIGVSAQGDFTLARLADGRVLAWGTNGSGQLGDASTVTHGYPAPVVDRNYLPVVSIGAVAGGWRHGLALTTDGRLLAWGEDTQGQLGDGGWVNRNRAAAVSAATGGDLTGVAVIAAGGYHSLALLTNGTLVAWGDNSEGQLGSGTGADRRLPTPVTDAAGRPITGVTSANK